MDVASLCTRVDALLTSLSRPATIELQNAAHLGTISIMQALYGPDSAQEKALRTYVERLQGGFHPANSNIISHSINAIKGALTSIKAEFEAGFIGTLRARLTGETLTDLIKLGRALP